MARTTSQAWLLEAGGCRSRLTLGDCPQGHPDDVAVFARVRLGRLTPAPVEQRLGGGHARSWRRILGAGDASQHLDAHLGVSRASERKLGGILFRGKCLGVGPPPPVGAGTSVSGAATITRII